jgi:hypothetical protein
MKTKLFLSLTVVCLLFCNVGFSQAGESKFKMVIVNPNEKKIARLYPSFQIDNLSFTEANMNQQLDAKETGSIRFYLRNSGTITLQELIVNLSIDDFITGLNYTQKQTVKPIDPGDSILVEIPVSSDEKLINGLAKFQELLILIATALK